MAEPETASVEIKVDRWLSVVRVSTILCLLWPIFWLYYAFADSHEDVLPMGLSLVLPYMLILGLLNTRYRRGALALAVGTSLIGIPLGLLDPGLYSMVLFHIGLAFSSLKTLRLLGASGREMLWSAGGVFSVYLIITAIVLDLWQQPRCLVQGSQIDTPSGSVQIEDLHNGQQILTRAPSGELQVGWVQAKHTAWSIAHQTIVLSDGRTLRATAQHPVATSTGWKLAGQLEAGESLWSSDGWRKVVAVKQTYALARVVDLVVEPNSNFFANGVLVHNKTSIVVGNEVSAISSVRNIVSSQLTYSAKEEGRYAASLTELHNAGLIDDLLGEGTKNGYEFKAGGGSSEFYVFARPQIRSKNGRTGYRSFYSNESGVIRYTTADRPATADDPVLGK